MKNIFTEHELKCGMFIIKNNVGKPLEDLRFSRTVAFKVGFSHGSVKKYGLSSFLTDGFYSPISDSLKGLADYLNNDEEGYRPLTKDELIELIVSSDQGFY